MRIALILTCICLAACLLMGCGRPKTVVKHHKVDPIEVNVNVNVKIDDGAEK